MPLPSFLIAMFSRHSTKRFILSPISDSCPVESAPNQCTVMRKLEVRQPSTNEKRLVTQYHYQKWPDFGVPEGKEVGNFLTLVNHVAEEYPSRDGKIQPII